jgi:hypothetical protein
VIASGLIAYFDCWACKEKSLSLRKSTNSNKEIHWMFKFQWIVRRIVDQSNRICRIMIEPWYLGKTSD